MTGSGLTFTILHTRTYVEIQRSAGEAVLLPERRSVLAARVQQDAPLRSVRQEEVQRDTQKANKVSVPDANNNGSTVYT